MVRPSGPAMDTPGASMLQDTTNVNAQRVHYRYVTWSVLSGNNVLWISTILSVIAPVDAESREVTT